MRLPTSNRFASFTIILILLIAGCAASAAKVALEPYRAEVNAAPDDPTVHYALGEAAIKQGEYRQGLKALKRCLELDPDNLDALALRGSAYNGIGDLEKCFRDLREVLSRDENHHDANVGLGTLEMSMVIQFESFATFNIAHLGTRLSDGQLMLLSMWDLYGDEMQAIYVECLDIWKRMVTIEPDSVYSWANLGVIANLTNNIEGSKVAFQQVRPLDPGFFSDHEFHRMVSMATDQGRRWGPIPPQGFMCPTDK
jgi:tetratricopeptide (TPR) repeat protein